MFKMWSCYIIILVSLVYAAKSVYLNAEHPQVGDNNKDVHHFTVQADDQPRDPANNVRASLLCRDGSECPSGSSCCEISVGQYGCCPQEKAICCLDQIHCCPEDYICDLGAGACLKGNTYVKWLTKQPAEHLAQNSVVCPGGWSQCPDGTTCCKMQTGEYGCCPYQKAVCCSDGIHCCPEGYTCNVAAGFCARKNEVINWKSKVESVHLKSSSHTCNDPGCPRRSTCCELATGQHGCCPLEQAVCCSDQIHCCPRGYKCDVSKGTCTLGSKASTWLTKVLSAPAETEV